jgi:hypothetical protein
MERGSPRDRWDGPAALSGNVESSDHLSTLGLPAQKGDRGGSPEPQRVVTWKVEIPYTDQRVPFLRRRKKENNVRQHIYSR